MKHGMGMKSLPSCLRKAEIKLFLAELDKLETVTEFHEDTWYVRSDYMTVYDKEDIRFTFKDGTEIQV
ncbi:MAG: hypothetical protein Q4E91_11000 [Lachnospiraceae bacterium]|nr:hypothetical protein [Lachnospiraceae bacterium]